MSAEGLALATASSIFAAIYQQTAFSVDALWVKLHTSHPGAAGTANPAGETTRMEATACFGTDPVDNGDGTATITSDGDIGPWLAVSTSEQYTHYSLWDDATAGSFIHSGEITADPVTAGDNWTAPAGSFTTTFAIAN